VCPSLTQNQVTVVPTGTVTDAGKKLWSPLGPTRIVTPASPLSGTGAPPSVAEAEPPTECMQERSAQPRVLHNARANTSVGSPNV
jgi:hypothetical protein